MSTLRVRTCLGEPVEGTLVLTMQERHKAELIKETHVKAALMSMFTNWKALAALLVAMGAFIATFVLNTISQSQAIVLVAAWIGGTHTFFRVLFDTYFGQLHKR